MKRMATAMRAKIWQLIGTGCEYPGKKRVLGTGGKDAPVFVAGWRFSP
jgi:hypothetical protein